jgi:hypothetical protein
VSSEMQHERMAHGKCVLWSLTPVAEVAVSIGGPRAARSPSGTRASRSARPASAPSCGPSVRWRI